MNISEKAARVRMLFLDIDGTMTDGKLHFGDGGFVARSYNTLDGHGIRLFMQAGGDVAVVTAATDDDSIRCRVRVLGIRHYYAAVADKLSVVKEVLSAENLQPEQAGYVGDDVQDLAALQYVGLACAPKTAMAEVLAAAHYVPRRPAGGGAVREVCDLIMAQWKAKEEKAG